MTDKPNQPYYLAYEQRYRSVYAQGVTHWSAHPDEIRATHAQITLFLEEMGLEPGQSHIIEFGCGEGYVGEFLAGKGYRYTGVDIASSAIAKAQVRLAGFGDRAEVLVSDILDRSQLPAGPFDAAIDVMSLHMLIVDSDRRAYLRNAHRLLKAGSGMFFCQESCRLDSPAQPIDSFESWMRIRNEDYVTPEPRDAWQDGQMISIRLPRLPTRPRSIEQYEAEMAAAGFVDCTVAAQKPKSVSFSVRRV